MYETPWTVESADECFFYHTTDVPGHGVVVGQWDLRGQFENYTGGLDFRGKRVLDIGTASGFLAFSAEDAGASEVVGFEMDTAERQHLMPFAGSRFVDDYPGWLAEQNAFVDRWKRGFWLIHKARNSRVKAHYGDVYAVSPDLGAFDIVIVGAVLEHLRDPFAALASIALRASDTLVINASTLPNEEPLAHFAGRAANRQQNYTWWVWSKGMYREALSILGFREITMTEASYNFVYGGVMDSRTAIVAKK